VAMVPSRVPFSHCTAETMGPEPRGSVRAAWAKDARGEIHTDAIAASFKHMCFDICFCIKMIEIYHHMIPYCFL
jgi:hypothetical protein